ncbi:MAG: Gldg family protein [Spirochaetia bacterium]
MAKELEKKSYIFWAYIQKGLRTPQSRYGLLSTTIISLAFAAFILLVLIFEQLPGELDMTKTKLYTLSESSKAMLQTLDQKISISLVWQDAIEKEYGLDEIFLQVDNFLQRYQQLSHYIEYRVIDPIVYPDLLVGDVQNLPQMGHGSIIVANDNFQRLIPFESWAGFYGKKRVSFNVEPPVSHAILYVNTGKMPKIYTVSGHEETLMQALIESTGVDFGQSFLQANYQIEDLALNLKDIPKDADALIILAPKIDFSTNDIAQLSAYIEGGGRIWLHQVFTGKTQPNINRLLFDYGINVQGFVAEKNEDRLIPNMKANPLYFLAQPQTFEITKDFLGLGQFLVVGQAVGFQRANVHDLDLRIFPLLKSSDQGVVFDRNANGELVRIIENQEIELAYAITKQYGDVQAIPQTRIFLSTGDLNLMSSFPHISGFYLNGVNWLTQDVQTLNITSKSLSSMPLQISASQFVLLGFLFIMLIPILIFVAGFAVWKRRRLM